MQGIDLGCRWYIIDVLYAREAPGGQLSREGGARQVPSSDSGSGADQAPSAIQLRVRILQMSPVFTDLSDGAHRALARNMRVVGLPARDTFKLGDQSGDTVVFLASGLVEQSVAHASGEVVLILRHVPCDLVVLPAPGSADRYMTSIYGLSDAVLLTLDIDGLVQSLGPEADTVAVALDKLRDQQLAAIEVRHVQAESRIGAPIVAFFSAKGGSGVTTLAVNSAAALAQKNPRQVLLIDLSAPFGHAALFADLVATGSIASASKASTPDFETVIRANIVNHRTGLGVLPATLRPEQVDLMTAELTGHALDVAGSWHRLAAAQPGTHP